MASTDDSCTFSEIIICPNPTRNSMNTYEEYLKCYKVFLPGNADILKIQKIKGTTHLSPGFPSGEAVEIIYERKIDGKLIKISRVYTYGLKYSTDWHQKEL